MPVFMDDIATIGSLEVKRGIRNSTRKENKIYDSKNRKRKEEVITKEVKGGVILKESCRVKSKLFETFLKTAFTYGLEAWAKITKEQIKELDRKQGKILKGVFQLSITTSYIGLLMETSTYQVECSMQY